jgi:hypothetical protein
VAWESPRMAPEQRSALVASSVPMDHFAQRNPAQLKAIGALGWLAAWCCASVGCAAGAEQHAPDHVNGVTDAAIGIDAGFDARPDASRDAASRTNKQAFAAPREPLRLPDGRDRLLAHCARCKAANVRSARGHTGAFRGRARCATTPDRPTRARPAAGRAPARTPTVRAGGRAPRAGCG